MNCHPCYPCNHPCAIPNHNVPTMVSVSLGKIWWIQGAYCLMVEQDMIMDNGLRMSVCWMNLAATLAI